MFLLMVAFCILLVTQFFDKNRKWVHYFSCLWGNHYARINPFWKLKYIGLENADPAKTYIYIANHQSFADIMILYGIFKPYKWVSKSSIAKIPFVGHNMYLNQYVLLERENLSSIKQMMKDCQNWLERGASILLFPEGTSLRRISVKKFLQYDSSRHHIFKTFIIACFFTNRY